MLVYGKDLADAGLPGLTAQCTDRKFPFAEVIFAHHVVDADRVGRRTVLVSGTGIYILISVVENVRGKIEYNELENLIVDYYNRRTNPMKVVIMESLGIPESELKECQRPFEEKGVVFESYTRTTDEAKLIEEAGDADAMILANMPMSTDVIRACRNLKFIDIAFTGVDHVGLEAAREKKIAVSNASGYSNEAVSELVLGMVLSLARNMREVEERCREGKTKDGLVGWELKGKTVGIIGLGKIGSRTAELFNAFGCRILAQSRTVHKEVPAYVEQVTQEELLASADIVVLHCPLNDSTRGMINAEKLSMMKPSAMLINVARGPVVVEKDLAEALSKGVIACAGIDVFDKEPPLDIESPLLKAPHTLVTPHVAFATKESMSLRAKIVFENLENWMEGRQSNIVL